MYIEGFWSRERCGNLIQSCKYTVPLTMVAYWHKRRRQFDIYQNTLDSLLIHLATCIRFRLQNKLKCMCNSPKLGRKQSRAGASYMFSTLVEIYWNRWRRHLLDENSYSCSEINIYGACSTEPDSTTPEAQIQDLMSPSFGRTAVRKQVLPNITTAR